MTLLPARLLRRPALADAIQANAAAVERLTGALKGLTESIRSNQL